MKKISITILFLLLGFVVKAQEDITLFRFLSKKQENGKVYSLTANVKDGALMAKEIKAKDFTIETGYLETFLIIPHPAFNNGEVLIVSAKNKKNFLKRDVTGTKLELGNYYTDTLKSKDYYYKWSLNYAGSNNQVYFQAPLENTTSGVLTLSRGVFKVQRVEDTKGGLAPVNGEGIASGERISDKQIIVIQKIKNTL
ncbi:hypothetical protein [Tenacibaculum sp. 190524A02b]|uniref:hypothetical protein n=1 Tax=Tenacibaculum vairaonense TaxID=3137860 RepID=UPI0031FAD048